MWRVDKEVFALEERSVGTGVIEFVARSRCPVRLHACAEVVLSTDLRIGDRFPEALRAGADVNLEDFLHWALQFLFQSGQTGGPRLGVFAHPPVMDEADRNRVEIVQLFPPPPSADNEAGLLESTQVFCSRDP